MNKALKIILIILISLLAVFLSATAAFFAITAGAKLQPQKLIDYGKSISIYDDDGNKIESASLTAKRKSVHLNELNEDTINAFIASEDRNFYGHNGLNYKRMAKALVKNVASFSFKEGASTISQQLIKNTHLSGDKTISRKLKEIRLTRQLEKKYSKDEILEMYLNTIYFGHNCYGLQSAANFYFDKNADELNLEESATIVGLLTSPNNFSPFKNPDKCLNRRNIVLKSMLDCNFIDKNQYDNAKNSPINAHKSESQSKFSDYYTAIFDELEELDIAEDELCEHRIETYLNQKLQNDIENMQFDCDKSLIVRNYDGGIAAFSSTIGQAQRQIGSTAKPLFVYAPAINEQKIQIFTKINDEPVNYGGYTPENYDKRYRGKVAMSECLSQSLNVPAVKTLNSIGVSTAEKYAQKMGISLEKEEKNLSLALGGMTHGLSLKQLCDCYSVFQSGGNYAPSHFIKKITDKNGKIIYENKILNSKVFSEGTCSLINEVLCQTSKTGTAKKLKNLDYDVASKTGTCGNAEGNTDAYAISYTSDYCIGVWLGDSKNNRLQVYGGNQCCEGVLQILNGIYADNKPAPLEKNAGTKTVEIDYEEYEKNDKILLCDSCSPKFNRLKVKCLTENTPKEISTRFSSPTIKMPGIIVNKDHISIQLCQTKYYSYIVKRLSDSKSDIIYDGKWQERIIDKPSSGNYVYEVVPYYDDGKVIHKGTPVTLPRVYFNPQNSDYKVPDIAYKDWYNQ